jgi:hypothetical protein
LTKLKGRFGATTLGTMAPLPPFVHFYPFRPDREQGGTLRLRTAVRATEPLGETVVVWFDAPAGRWRTEEPAAGVDGAGAHGAAASAGLKRRVFPHTLFESGRHAVAALIEQWSDHIKQGAVPLLHTSYLAPAIKALPEAPIVDVYDLVWRGHEIDARAAQLPLAAVRAAYAARVRRSEETALRRARALLVAGWDDHRRLEHLGRPSRWVPTGVSAEPVAPRPPDGRLRIGFLGNFAHQPTLDSANALLASPAAQAPEIDVVLGGWESDRHPALRDAGATILGPVATPADFWREVDAAVIPVFSGTGIKVKIAEALLAGRTVVTTPLGAAGFSPETREGMVVVQRLPDLDAATCLAALIATRRDVAHEFSLATTAAAYRDFLVSVL